MQYNDDVVIMLTIVMFLIRHVSICTCVISTQQIKPTLVMLTVELLVMPSLSYSVGCRRCVSERGNICIRPTEKGVRGRVSTRVSGWVSTFVQPVSSVISLHKFLVGKYVKIHKIDQCHLL